MLPAELAVCLIKVATFAIIGLAFAGTVWLYKGVTL